VNDNGFIAVKRAKHGLYAFNRNDLFIGRSLDLYGEWAESEIQVLSRFIAPGDTVVDIGANIGTHTLPFARAVGERGSVIAFEPQRWPYHLLCANVSLNGYSNVRCLRQAAGSVNGRLCIPDLSPHEVLNFGAVAAVAGGGTEIEAITVDSLELSSCRLIKIDVEGMEPQVLAGAVQTIASHRPVLFVENNTIDKAASTLSALLGLGYRLWWHLALYYNPANFFGNEENVFARFQPEANLLCLPAGEDPGVPELIECTGERDNWKLAMQRGIEARNPLFFPGNK
jgi:FkbM family methyltransferase